MKGRHASPEGPLAVECFAFVAVTPTRCVCSCVLYEVPMKTLVRAFICVVAVCICAAASPTHISGRVAYPNGAAAEFVRVQLWSDTISFRTETNTDKQGKYSFDGVPNSTYHLLIELVGYQAFQSNVDISMNGMAYEDVVLKPKPGTNPPEASAPASGAILDARVAAITPDAKKEFEAGQQAM